MSSSKWNSNLSQDQYMLKDQCILLDMNDQIVGSQSKKTAHVFDTKNGTSFETYFIFALTRIINPQSKTISHIQKNQYEDNFTEPSPCSCSIPKVDSCFRKEPNRKSHFQTCGRTRVVLILFMLRNPVRSIRRLFSRKV